MIGQSTTQCVSSEVNGKSVCNILLRNVTQCVATIGNDTYKSLQRVNLALSYRKNKPSLVFFGCYYREIGLASKSKVIFAVFSTDFQYLPLPSPADHAKISLDSCFGFRYQFAGSGYNFFCNMLQILVMYHWITQHVTVQGVWVHYKKKWSITRIHDASQKTGDQNPQTGILNPKQESRFCQPPFDDDFKDLLGDKNLSPKYLVFSPCNEIWCLGPIRHNYSSGYEKSSCFNDCIMELVLANTV